jgi:hypothetical protein
MHTRAQTDAEQELMEFFSFDVHVMNEEDVDMQTDQVANFLNWCRDLLWRWKRSVFQNLVDLLQNWMRHATHARCMRAYKTLKRTRIQMTEKPQMTEKHVMLYQIKGGRAWCAQCGANQVIKVECALCSARVSKRQKLSTHL